MTALNIAAGAWIAALRVVVINAAHPALDELDESSYEAMLARIAWHEWALVLSVVRATPETSPAARAACLATMSPTALGESGSVVALRR